MTIDTAIQKSYVQKYPLLNVPKSHNREAAERDIEDISDRIEAVDKEQQKLDEEVAREEKKLAKITRGMAICTVGSVALGLAGLGMGSAGIFVSGMTGWSLIGAGLASICGAVAAVKKGEKLGWKLLGNISPYDQKTAQRSLIEGTREILQQELGKARERLEKAKETESGFVNEQVQAMVNLEGDNAVDSIIDNEDCIVVDQLRLEKRKE